jgi:hypothetical protein
MVDSRCANRVMTGASVGGALGASIGAYVRVAVCSRAGGRALHREAMGFPGLAGCRLGLPSLLFPVPTLLLVSVPGGTAPPAGRARPSPLTPAPSHTTMHTHTHSTHGGQKNGTHTQHENTHTH